MRLYAGIHISDGKSVNPDDLVYQKNKIITLDPVLLALHWQDMGAQYLHIIDLDAVTMGYPVNDETIHNIVDAVDIPVQYGGGLRTIKDIDYYLNMGVARVILSTQALQEPHFLKEAVQLFGADRILIGLDADNGMVFVEGRTKISNFNVLTLAQEAEKSGVHTCVYTDVNCSSKINEPDLENTRELIEHTHLNVIYSGGITSLQDLKNMEKIGAAGVMLGGALYTNKIKLQEAVMLYERGDKNGL